MRFFVPPGYDGQIVTYSYATCLHRGVGYVIEERFDASDRTTTYAISKLLSSDDGEYWNHAPRNKRWRKISQDEFESIRD